MSTTDDGLTVSVKLTTMLAKYRPASAQTNPFAVELPAGSTVGDLIDRLGIPRPLAKLVFVDHTQRRAEDALADGVHVELFPPIAGG